MVQKIDVTIAKLRLLLADASAKERQYTAVRQQFRDQLRRAVEYSVYGNASLDGTLSLMEEIQQRIVDAEGTLRNLELVRARAARELESLQLTKRIEAAKTELGKLLEQQAELERESPPTGASDGLRQELGEQIRALRQQINEASEQAARTIGRR
jgi:hypothetical protein